MKIISATDSLHHLLKQSETDEEFWARMEREHPGEQSARSILYSPDQAGQAFDEEGYEPDLDEDVPENTSLAEHSHLLRNGFEWDGDDRRPSYTRRHWREVVDADGQPAYDEEHHTVDRNPHVTRPEFGDYALAYPWTHTYYPAGQSDEEGLTAGYNTAQQATRAANHLSLWGARTPEGQAILSRYRYLGSDEPYSPSEELLHERAQGMGREAAVHESGKIKDTYDHWKDATSDLIWWASKWNPELKSGMAAYDQLNALGHPDYYDKDGNLVQKGWDEPDRRPSSKGVRLKDIYRKHRDWNPDYDYYWHGGGGGYDRGFYCNWKDGAEARG